MKRFLLVFLLTLAVLPAFAQVKPHTFSPNDPVSSAKINSNYDVIYQWCQELATQALTLYSKTLYSSSDTSSPYWHKNNDGSGSGLDADLLDGYHASHTRNLANSIPIRDGSGDLQLGWINTTSGSAGTTAPDRVYASYDSYLRYYTPANFKTVMGLIHTGNFQSTNSSGVVNPNNTTMNGLYYCNSVNLFGQTDGALYNQAHSSAWQGQIFQDYRTGQLALRGKNNGTWQPWRTVRDSTNFVAGTDSASYCAGNDSRLSNARTPTSHTHGSITNDGKVGTTANLPLITGTGGVVQAGSFGTTANTFCQGNDSRLSDARTPTAHNHDASNITAGTLPAARIGANSITNDKLSNTALKMPAGAILDITAKGCTTASIARAGGVIDVSGQGNHGQALGGVAVVDSEVGKAFSFDGVNDTIGFTAAPFRNIPAFSVSMWIKTAGMAPGMTQNGYLSNQYNPVIYGNSSGKLRVDVTNHSVSDTTSHYDNQWHHFVVVADSLTIKIYRDGALVASAPCVGITWTAWSTQYVIGRNLNDAPWYGKFLLSSFKQFNRALTAEEIKTLYMLGSDPSIGRITADLVESDEIWTKNNLTTATAGTANTVALRDSSGDITTRLFRSTYAAQTTTPATTVGLAFRNSTSDNYIRFMTAAAFKAWLLSAKIGVVQTSAPASPVNGDIWIE